MAKQIRYLSFALFGIFILFSSFQYYEETRVTVFTARKVVDPKSDFEYDAVQKAKRIGAKIVPLLLEQSANFSKVNSHNAERIAIVLGAIKSKAALDIATELYSRDDKWSRLAGAHALLHHDAFPEKTLTRTSFLAQRLLEQESATQKDPYAWRAKESEIAAESIAHFDSSVALPLFLEAANAGITPYTLCQYLSRSESPDAVPGLLACLTDCHFNCEEMTAKLLLNGDKRAIPVLINGLKTYPNDYNFTAGKHRKLLVTITGENFGDTKSPWTTWWEANKNTWEIPEALRKPGGLKTEKIDLSSIWGALAHYSFGPLSFIAVFCVILCVLEIRRSRKLSRLSPTSLDIANAEKHLECSKEDPFWRKFIFWILRYCSFGSLVDGQRCENSHMEDTSDEDKSEVDAGAKITVYAGLGSRLVAALVDSLILLPLCIPLFFTNDSIGLTIAAFACLALMPQAYDIYFHTKYGATLGKMLLKIRVFNLEGGPITLSQAISRSFVYIVFAVVELAGHIVATRAVADAFAEKSITALDWLSLIKADVPNWSISMERTYAVWLCLELIVLLVNQRKRAMHDLIAETVVVHTNS